MLGRFPLEVKVIGLGWRKSRVLWTPTFTFATPGNLSLSAYSVRTGRLRIDGDECKAYVALAVTPTHTTASGALTITGLPLSSSADSNYFYLGPMQFMGVTKTNYTQFVPRVNVSSNTIIFIASGSGQANDTINAADIPSGGSFSVVFEVTFRR